MVNIMTNELLLIFSLVFIYGGVLVAYKLFGRVGLFCFTAIAAILANIEVAMLIEGFGMVQTLGNVLFASSFLVTDILSENYGKKDAQVAVNIGIFTSVIFIVLAQSWLLYHPIADHAPSAAFPLVFGNTPRILGASFFVYAVSQRFDVFLYHKWWDISSKWKNDRRPYLWLRNNGSTLFSQLLNTVMFNVLAFAGTESWGTVLSIIISCYVIFIFTSLLDTPVVYIARRIKPRMDAPVKQEK